MSNNDFDKILNEKLEGYETGFNPADWQKMEAMLPQDSRKFFFVIASLFVLLFLTTGVLMMNNFLYSNGTKKLSALAESERGKEFEPDYGGIQFVPNKADNTELQQSKQTLSSDCEMAEEGKSALNKEAGLKINASNAESHEMDSQDRIAELNVTPIAGKTKSRESVKKKNKAAKEGTGFSKADNNRTALNKTDSYTVSSGQKTVATTVANDPVDASAEALAMLNAGLITSVSDDKQIGSLEVMESVLRKKRKVFEFGLGVGAGPIFSFVDAHYFSKPGYAVGISQELMFIQRVGLVLSESYAHRKYDGGQYPCTGTPGLNCPQSYSSDVKSIDFGIDIKANLIRKARWDWFVKAGVINVLKIKESFEYHYPDIDTVSPPPPPNSYGLSTSTNFNGSNQTESFDAITGGLTNRTPEPDLTISGTKRYHVAYHFATGFDVLLNSRMKLQFEADYSFTKRIVGPEDKRFHSTGINGKMFFLFGK